MNRILVPIDGSPRSLYAVEEIKRSFSPKAFEIILLMVKESQSYVPNLTGPDEEIMKQMADQLDEIAQGLENYAVIKKTAIGKPGNRIVECAKEMGVKMIVMTKSTKTNLANSIGMTASHVIRHASCNVMIVQESKRFSLDSYRGLVYRKAESVVNLRGQLSQKQSECILPCVKGDTVYRIEVIRGKIRFIHSSYNVETGDWDIPPLNGQQESYELSEGETADIPVNSENDLGKLDRIRVVNRSLKTEAVFRYRITRP